jgi:hypothetical protein
MDLDFGADTVAVGDRALEEVSDRGKADMRVRPGR